MQGSKSFVREDENVQIERDHCKTQLDTDWLLSLLWNH